MENPFVAPGNDRAETGEATHVMRAIQAVAAFNSEPSV
jgi:hypothetical protein